MSAVVFAIITPSLSFAVAALGGNFLTLFTKPVDGGFKITIAFCQGFAAIHHSAPVAWRNFIDIGCCYRCARVCFVLMNLWFFDYLGPAAGLLLPAPGPGTRRFVAPPACSATALIAVVACHPAFLQSVLLWLPEFRLVAMIVIILYQPDVLQTFRDGGCQFHDIEIDFDASSLEGMAKSTLLGSQFGINHARCHDVQAAASARAICSWPISTRKGRPGCGWSGRYHPVPFPFYPYLGPVSGVPFWSGFLRFRQTTFFDALHFLHALTYRVEVGEHTTQPRSVTNGMLTLGAFLNDFFGLLFGSNNMIFLPLRAMAFIAAAASCKPSTVLFRSMMWIPFFSAKI